MPLSFSLAAAADLPAIADLVNSAYRGDASRQGWTTEADWFDGPRTDEAHLRELLAAPGAAILQAHDPATGQRAGCVYVQPQGPNLYVGMLAVAPAGQARGTGRQLMAAAAEHARRVGCEAIQLSVLAVRPELRAWYERHGFRATGETEPLHVPARFGGTRQPLELVYLRKLVA